MPTLLQVQEDHVTIVTLSGGFVHARTYPLDDVSCVTMEASITRS